MRQPAFWSQGKGGWRARLLTPAAWIYRCGAGLRNAVTTAWTAPVPVICVGNVTAGGAGKTPLALDLGRRLAARGRRVHFLSRGYGGTVAGPVQVDPDRHGAAAVGDEPLLLAAVAPTWVAAERTAGAREAAASGAGIIIMDDGFQNPGIAKDLAVLVIDGGFGLGNGNLIPAGPLREPLAAALGRADAVVCIGDDRTGMLAAVPDRLPVLKARIVPTEATAPDRPVVAFAGIGRPEKFFETLGAAGHEIAETVSFADHHPFGDADLAALHARADAHDAGLITTEKDLMRLAPAARTGITALTITLQWEDEAALDGLLESHLGHGAAP